MRFARLLLSVCPLMVAGAQTFHPDIPRAWDDKDVASAEMPLAQPDRSPRYMSAAEYYALKPRVIYRSYPAYVTGKEPLGYLDSLKQKDPRSGTGGTSDFLDRRFAAAEQSTPSDSAAAD